MLLSFLLVWMPVWILKATAAEFRTHNCGLNISTINTSTTYYSNLVQVLDSLASDKVVTNKQFLAKSAGNHQPDIVYGIYLCRSDALPNDCRNCLLVAREEINKTCPNSKVAVFWMDDCMLRYANYSMVSIMDSSTFVPECNKVNISNMVSEQTRFWEAARDMMGQLARKAETDPKKMYAFNEISYNNDNKLYGYVQCTPDLSDSDCGHCLRSSIDRLGEFCFGKEGARVLTPSCNVRFETYKFLRFLASSSSDPPGLTSPSCSLLN